MFSQSCDSESTSSDPSDGEASFDPRGVVTGSDVLFDQPCASSGDRHQMKANSEILTRAVKSYTGAGPSGPTTGGKVESHFLEFFYRFPTHARNLGIPHTLRMGLLSSLLQDDSSLSALTHASSCAALDGLQMGTKEHNQYVVSQLVKYYDDGHDPYQARFHELSNISPRMGEKLLDFVRRARKVLDDVRLFRSLFRPKLAKLADDTAVRLIISR